VKEVMMYQHKATFRETEDISLIIRTENARGAIYQAYGLYSAFGKGDPGAKDVFLISWLQGLSTRTGLINGTIPGAAGTCETTGTARHTPSHEQAIRDESIHSGVFSDHFRYSGPSSHPEVTC
jgi:hypothetical protein